MAKRTQQQPPVETEASVQQEMFRSLLRTPHREVDAVIALHKTQYNRDPNFYGHLAVHATMRGGCAIHDINEVFIATLFASEYPEHREAAFVMLQSLPPYQVYRVMRDVMGWKEIRFHRSFDPPISTEHGTAVTTIDPAKTKTVSLTRNKRLRGRLLKNKKIAASVTSFTVSKQLVAHPGLEKSMNGELKRAIRTYLRTREHPARRNMLESGLLRAKKFFKTLYAKTHTLPGGAENSWVNQYLFKGRVEEGTRLAALQQLSLTNDPIVQAELIVKNKIPCPVAISFLKNMTPSVIVALIETMSPQELMANIGNLNKRGALADATVKTLVEQKLQSAKSAKKGRIDALKGAFAAAQVEGLDEDIVQIMTEVTDTQLKQHGTILAKTALLIDKSASMDAAIAAAKEIGAVLAQGCSNLLVYTFDVMPTEIKITEDMTTKSAWDKALRMVRAGGGTEPDKVIQKMILENIAVDQILLLTDEAENTRGNFANSLAQYKTKFGYVPNIIIVRLGRPGAYPWGACDHIEMTCKALGYTVDVMKCEQVDKIAMPNLLQLLSRKSIFELVQEILALPLPTRKEWEIANKKQLQKMSAATA